jgi:lysophospholipase L1-like esterase
LNVLPARKEKPIVTYGTSICQGACASRPGMAWTNILERKLERPIINMGFSGNGRLEPALIDLMTEVDAKLYILDCLPNLKPEKDDVYQLVLDAVKKLKEKRPNIPIILTAHIGYANELNNKFHYSKQAKLNNELYKAFHHLKQEGTSGIFLLQKENLALNFDSFVDFIHPNDFGMIQYANAYEKLIRQVIFEEKGNISTTFPCTQNRDIATYKWEDRHQQILELNKTNPPKICLFGNSIINFWGGTPKCKVQNGLDSWEQTLASMGIRNFGFGWDRIENVLWRVYHDELDSFKAEQIVLMIGTNNLMINTPNEIIIGLKKLIRAIKVRQPQSRITMMGILPRTNKEDYVKKLNLKISQLAELENIHYRNIGHNLLLQNNKIDNALFVDGLHPNKKGYRLLAEELKNILKEK